MSEGGGGVTEGGGEGSGGSVPSLNPYSLIDLPWGHMLTARHPLTVGSGSGCGRPGSRGGVGKEGGRSGGGGREESGKFWNRVKPIFHCDAKKNHVGYFCVT